jgi:hypothetical protein
MSKSEKAIEILEAIHKHFDHEGQGVLYGDALILSDDTTIKDAIAQCLEPEQPDEPVIPRSQRKRIVHNRGIISGWIGTRKAVKQFADLEAAHRWFNENAQIQ